MTTSGVICNTMGEAHILVIDADAAARFFTCMLLQRFGYYIFSAGSMKEAATCPGVKSPCAIVVDAELMDSAEMNKLKKNLRLANVPVMVLSRTPHADMEQQWVLREPIAAYLTKPLNVEEFYRTVQRVIKKGTRRNIRVPTLLAARLEDRNAEDNGYVTELSADGLLFQGVACLPKDTRVPIRFDLKGRTILLEATVLYNTAGHVGPFLKPGMGMRFDRVSPVDRDLIKTFVLERVQEGAPWQRHLQ